MNKTNRAASAYWATRMKIRALVLGLALLGGSGLEAREAHDYLWSMIACPEADEMHVDHLYNAYLHLLAGRVLRPEMDAAPAGAITVPVSRTEVTGTAVIASQGYYVSPNVLRGFELVFPKEALVRQGDHYVLLKPLVLAKQTFRSEIHILELQIANPTSAPEPTGRTGSP